MLRWVWRAGACLAVFWTATVGAAERVPPASETTVTTRASRAEVGTRELLTGHNRGDTRALRVGVDVRPSLRLADLALEPAASESRGTSTARSRVVIPALLSAALPGAGEIYSGHIWNGLPLLAAEVATWIGYAHFQREGERLRDDYQRFADAHWDSTTWANRLMEHYGPDDPPPNWYNQEFFANCDCSPPFIPKGVDPQEYYENAGKYRHFWVGWDDWVYNPDDPANSDSRANRRIYVDLRIDSNNNFDNRTRMLGVAALTRVVSVVQSIWLVKRDTRRDGLMLEPVTFKGFGSGIRLTLSY